jgi:hypothetical protein
VKILGTLYGDIERVVLDAAPQTKCKVTTTSKRMCLGSVYMELEIPFPNIEDIPFRGNVGSRYWDILAGGYISIYSVDKPTQGRSANLWFGKLIEGDDYRWWEVSYVGENDDGVPAPFGLIEHNRGRTGNLPYHVAEDPRPITPEFIDEFMERWIDVFARGASLPHWELDTLFTRKHIAQKIATRFDIS